MSNPYKGIYMKFRDDGGTIEDIVYENIVIDQPIQWPIWIGPAQQADSSDLCRANPCSLCWPALPSAQCRGRASTYRNIPLKNITINSPMNSPGVILADSITAMENVIFEDVIVNNPALLKYDYHTCEGVKSGVARGKTRPVPSCFEDQTDGGEPQARSLDRDSGRTAVGVMRRAEDVGRHKSM